MKPGAGQCWLCRAKMPRAVEQPSLAAADALARIAMLGQQKPAAAKPRSALHFGAESLMLVFALAIVLIGLFGISPGLGAAAFVLTAPAVLRVLISSWRARAAGWPMSSNEKKEMALHTFAITLAIAGGLIVLAIGAFVALILITCSPNFH